MEIVEDKKEEAEDKNKKGETGRILSPLFTIIIVIVALHFVFGNFTIVSFKEQRMLVLTLELSPQRLFRGGEGADGWVFGNRILETEHGEITLGHWSEIRIWNHNIGRIHPESFRRGRATHNLSIEGIAPPKIIEVAFADADNPKRISWVEMNPMQHGNQETIISGIPFVFSYINFNNFIFYGYSRWGFPEGGIVLSDSTQIKLPFPQLWSLNFHSENETWTFGLLPTEVVRRYILVKLPGETEFQRYISVTFGQNWGDFIGGVLFEEDRIILSDGTQIAPPFRAWAVDFHHETETWTLRLFPRYRGRLYFIAKRPGQTEFQQFASITFRQHWGEFIDGVLFERDI